MSDFSPFEQLVLQKFDEVKSDADRNFNLLSDHIKDNNTRFAGVDAKIESLTLSAAEDKGGKIATAKTWGIVGGAGSAIIGGLATFLKYFHHAAK